MSIRIHSIIFFQHLIFPGSERRTKYGCEGSLLELECEEGAVINLVRELKGGTSGVSVGSAEFSLSRLEAYRWWYAFRKKHDLKITAKKK